MMTVTNPGDYIVRFDGTTSDGVHVVRTRTVSLAGTAVNTSGYYTGTTTAGGIVMLVVGDDGVGRFLGGDVQGRYRLGFSVADWGGFTFTDQTGAVITGRIDASGSVTGSIDGTTTFSGVRQESGFGAPDPARDGDYAGWVLDSGVRAAAHVDRGRVALVVEEDGAERTAEGTISADGAFVLTPGAGATFSGSADGGKLKADIALPGASARRLVLLRSGFAPTRRLVNLSLRGLVGSGDAALIPGFVVQGSEPLPMLVRGIGPGLADYDITGFIAQPRLQLFNGANVVVEDTGWSSASNVSAIADAAARVHAFALDPARLDSAILSPLSGGAYTATITGVDGGTGIALAEAYDARLGNENARLVNLSGRGFVGTGDNILIGGFVVAGDAPALVLVRAVGPSLADFHVGGLLAKPQLTIFRGSTAIATGTAWGLGGAADDVVAAADLAQAFALPPDSADAALLLFLEPGKYTAQVRGLNDTTGIALVEVYIVPEFQ